MVARRYPGWLTNVLVYGLAAGVSVTRVVGREHSPSDAFVGSALGFAIGQYVAGTSASRPPWYWARPAKDSSRADSKAADHEAAAGLSPSAYSPMDNWIYGALDRLAALGYIPSQISGIRPWTRAECRRQTEEADSHLPHAGVATFAIDSREQSQSAALRSEALDLVSALQKEFCGRYRSNRSDSGIAVCTEWRNRRPRAE